MIEIDKRADIEFQKRHWEARKIGIAPYRTTFEYQDLVLKYRIYDFIHIFTKPFEDFYDWLCKITN